MTSQGSSKPFGAFTSAKADKACALEGFRAVGAGGMACPRVRFAISCLGDRKKDR